MLDGGPREPGSYVVVVLLSAALLRFRFSVLQVVLVGGLSGADADWLGATLDGAGATGRLST